MNRQSPPAFLAFLFDIQRSYYIVLAERRSFVHSTTICCKISSICVQQKQLAVVNSWNGLVLILVLLLKPQAVQVNDPDFLF